MVRGSLRAFAEWLIDYAGIFPPAGLPLAEALANYVRFREGSDAWMLGRFVCPAHRLGEVYAPVRVSALAQESAAESFPAGLEAEQERIRTFHERIGPFGRVEALEIRLPDGAEPMVIPGLRLFYEAPSWEGIERTIEAIARRNASARAADPGSSPISLIGFKLRCGGVAPDAFPSIDTVAAAIAACRRAGVPFKATAGLHHPLRAFREEVGTKMHGFVNVFGASLLTYANDLDEERIRPILEEEDPAAFRFDDAAFSWRDVRITTERIRILRLRAVTSFGSCSFDEPRDDLRALGLLDSSGRSE